MPPASSPVDREAVLSRVRFRRAVTLLLMTLLLPGSAQLAAGRRQVGRIALRVWLGVLGTLAAVVLLGLVWHGFVYWLASNTVVLGFVRLVLCVLAVGWAGLFLDAWRLGRPLELLQKQRLAMVGLNGVLCFAVAGSLLFASHVVAVQKGFISAMFGDGVATAAHHGRYNVLLLGGDSGRDRWGLRPDSITVASVDENTGKTVLFGLPRNMLNFPFAKGSIMAQQFPHGYNCGITCELNSLVTWAADHKPLFKGVANPGIEATTEAVEGITGLKINYYAMVNLQGFQKMVDAVGGVTLNVRDRIPIGGIGAPVSGYIKPGKRKLNGFQTLWFARSRVAADDYSRMARQKCVMNAMLHQLSPETVVLKFESIAKASEQLIETNVPLSEVDRFISLALKARSQPVRTVSFVPPLINTGHPDIAKIKQTVQAALHPSKGGKAGAQKSGQKSGQTSLSATGTATGTTSTPPPAPQGTTGGAIGSMNAGYAANQAADLGSAC